MTNILEILVCPITKGRLDYDGKKQLLISHQAKLAFPIEDNIPPVSYTHLTLPTIYSV